MGCGSCPASPVLGPELRRNYGDGHTSDVLSTFIATWDQPGVLYRKRAMDCTPQEIAREAWEQLKRHVTQSGRPPTLTDDMLHSFSIAPAIKQQRGRLTSSDRLVLPTVATEQLRPQVVTAIPNLMLCGDYCSGPWDIGHLDAASFSGRRATNAVLEHARSRQPPAKAIEPYRPPEWEPFKKSDEDCYRRGQPNLFDTELTPAQPLQSLRRS